MMVDVAHEIDGSRIGRFADLAASLRPVEPTGEQINRLVAQYLADAPRTTRLGLVPTVDLSSIFASANRLSEVMRPVNADATVTWDTVVEAYNRVSGAYEGPVFAGIGATVSAPTSVRMSPDASCPDTSKAYFLDLINRIDAEIQ